jgi:hypothetical protein
MLNSSGRKDLRGTSQTKERYLVWKIKDELLTMTFASRSTCFIYFMVKPYAWVPERTHHGTVWTRVWPRADILKTE